MKNTLICPVCKNSLFVDGKSFFCKGEKKHCYDISSVGHVNLCPGKSTGGDDKRAVRSRTDFLNLGYYSPISKKLCEVLSSLDNGSVVVDAGCGEGYYSNNIARELGVDMFGFDLSKEAIIAASKSASRQGLNNTLFFVGGIYDIPVGDACADAVTNVFAPCCEKEFIRILKNGGMLVVVAAGRDHLLGLKRAIYDTVYTNEERADMPKEMKLEAKHNVRYTVTVEGAQAIRNLFSMTPYSYRTSEKDMEKLYALTTLTTEVDVDIFVYRKEVL